MGKIAVALALAILAGAAFGQQPYNPAVGLTLSCPGAFPFAGYDPPFWTTLAPGEIVFVLDAHVGATVYIAPSLPQAGFLSTCAGSVDIDPAAVVIAYPAGSGVSLWLPAGVGVEFTAQAVLPVPTACGFELSQALHFAR